MNGRFTAWPVILVALYGLVLAATAVSSTPERPIPPVPRANLLDKPLGEDAFYMLSVARSAAEGRGLSYGDTPTTGIQPLATFLYAGVYWVSERVGLSAVFPLRAVILLNVVLLLLTGVLSGTLVAHRLREAGVGDIDAERARAIVATLVVVNPAAFRLFTYGLETGLYLLFIVLLQRAIDRQRHWFVVGALLGLCILARLDFAVIGAVVFGWRLFTKRLAVGEAIGVAAVALLVIAPWLWRVHEITGGLMPSSGTAEAGLVTSWAVFVERAWQMLSAAGAATMVVVYLPVANTLVNVALASIAAVAGIVLLWLWPRYRRSLGDQGPWIAAAIALCGYYVIASAAEHFYGRYLAPFWLFWTQSIATAVAVEFARAERRRALIFSAATICLVALFAAENAYTLHRGHISNPHVWSALYIDSHTSELGTVGAFQSGVVGYETREAVINLDGKIDSRALAWRERGHEECYLAERRVNSVVDWPMYIENGWIDPQFVRTRMREVARVPGGHSVVMSVDTSGLTCPSVPPAIR